MKQFNWAEFYKATKEQPHWSLLEMAVALLGHTGRALDLGCGAGRDTRYLLARGWDVTAVDSEARAVALLAELPQERLQVIQSSFEDFFVRIRKVRPGQRAVRAAIYPSKKLYRSIYPRQAGY